MVEDVFEVDTDSDNEGSLEHDHFLLDELAEDSEDSDDDELDEDVKNSLDDVPVVQIQQWGFFPSFFSLCRLL